MTRRSLGVQAGWTCAAAFLLQSFVRSDGVLSVVADLLALVAVVLGLTALLSTEP